MNRLASHPARGRASRRAFSLIEVVVATMIMGILLVAAMRTVGNSIRAGTSTADQCKACWLAQELMSEILTARYADPGEAPVLGPEASETDGTRIGFDDVDDYHGWIASPPQDRDGTPIPDRAGCAEPRRSSTRSRTS